MSNVISIHGVQERRPVAGFLKVAARMFQAALEGFAHARKLHDDYLKLSTLTDPELQDMGIRRSDIAAVVTGSYPVPYRHNVSFLTGIPEQRSQFRRDNSRSRPKEKTMCQVSEEAESNEVDVRSLVPAKRHEKIFELVAELTAGDSFILVNDHDPKPLYYQLEAEYPSQFSWTYLEKGPDAWRVEIGRLQKAA
jgi:uncharacterized protein (DUF2249 family)/uncharacterized protein YjiS (DUF1127 family)